MTKSTLHPEQPFPELLATSLAGESIDISKPGADAEWRMVVVYRGVHCPMCTKYLNKLEGFLDRLSSIGIDLVAVSADSKEQLQEHLERLDISFPVYFGLTVEQMTSLGLYISNPRSEKETDHRFPEPGLFVINQNGDLHVVDLSNNPFVRPDIDTMLSGLEWIKNPDNHYPVRGTYSE